jgi:hypothetical protein
MATTSNTPDLHSSTDDDVPRRVALDLLKVTHSD